MSQQSRPVRRGLGRGLGALIPTAPTPTAEESGADEQSDASAGGGVGVPVPDVGAAAPSQQGITGDSAAPQGGGSAMRRGARDGSPRTESNDLAGPGPGDADAASTPDPMLVVAGAYFREVPLGQVRPNARQPRQVFDEEALAELVHSISEIGLLQPIVVRESDDDTFELIMGERRWRAAQQAGLEAIPAIVRQTDDADMLRDALLENLHRSQLNPLEEAAAYGQLLEDFGCTHEELAQRIGRSRPQISNTIRLLKLTPAVQRRVAAGVLSAGHARALLAVTDTDQQDRLAARVVAEGISVRALEEIVALGEDDAKPRAGRRKKPVAPGLVDLADRLSDRFETRVKVDLGKSKGKITVEFASLEDLQRIVDVMDPHRPETA